MKPAGFWIRLLASLIDTVIVALPLVAVIYLLSGGAWLDLTVMHESLRYALQGDAVNALQSARMVDMRWEILFEVLMAAVIILFWRRWAGATPGKKILGITVVDAKSGKVIDNKQAIVRYIGYIASTMILFIGFLMVAFRKDKCALHDLMAGTKVVYTKDKG